MGKYFFGITDKGNRREKNEDTFLLEELVPGELLLAAVIDGVGGYNGGEIAAAITRDVIREQMSEIGSSPLEALRAAVSTANDRIFEEKNKHEQYGQMACVVTCVLADLKKNKLYYVHVGDTRLYLLRDDSLVKLSRDHSLVGFLEESGRLTEQDAMRHPRRNEITKALGFETQLLSRPDFMESGESPFLPNDVLLLCSDGLSDMLDTSQIMKFLAGDGDLNGKTSQLVNAANEAGGDDNITVVLVKNTNKPMPKVVLKPTDKRTNAGEETKKEDEKVRVKTKKESSSKSPGFIALLIIVCCGILAIGLFENNFKPKAAKLPAPKLIATQPLVAADSIAMRFADAATSFQMDSAGTYTINREILLNKDSFYVKGNGATIVAGRDLKGPAMIIGKDSRKVILENLSFKDFDIALQVRKNNLVLKNVKFINCRVQIQHELSLPDTVLSGKLRDSIFIPAKDQRK